jgi:thiamine transport system substrate-binding protein
MPAEGGFMKKSAVLILAVFAFLCLFAGCSKKTSAQNELTVYAYDSFCGDWGPGEGLAKAFEEKTGIHVNLVSCDGAVELYSKVVYEGKACPADVVVGLSDSLDYDSSLFESWTPSCNKDLIEYDRSSNLIPFDYGMFAFIIDTYSNGVPTLRCLEDLTKDAYRKKVILIGPSSSVGLGLLKWTVAALGEEKAFSWWEKMKDNALTMSSSWSTAYGLFTENEAPIVISYTTSPVYHLMYEDSQRYQAVEFTDGHIKAVEYLGILKQSSNKDAAKQFCEFLLTEGQNDIAVANTMFPANTSTSLVPEFSIALMPSKIIETDITVEQMAKYSERWTEMMVK